MQAHFHVAAVAAAAVAGPHCHRNEPGEKVEDPGNCSIDAELVAAAHGTAEEAPLEGGGVGGATQVGVEAAAARYNYTVPMAAASNYNRPEFPNPH